MSASVSERYAVSKVGRWEVKIPKVDSRWESNAVDDRRNRTYGRRVHVTVRTTDMPEVLDADLPYNDTVLRTDEVLRDAVHEALSNLSNVTVKIGTYGRGNSWDPVSEANPWSAGIELFFSAEKPSLTLEASEVPDLLNGLAGGRSDSFVEVIARALEKVSANHAEMRALDAARTQAERLATFAASAANKRARKAVRFKQRLAALVAELKAEQAVQLEEVLAEGGWLDTAVAESEQEFDPRAVEAARKVASEFMPAANPGRFPSADRGLSFERMVELTGEGE